MTHETQEMEVSWWGRNWILVAILTSIFAAMSTVIGFGLVGAFSVPADEQLAEMTPEQDAAYSAMRLKLNGVARGTVLTSNIGTMYLVAQVDIGGRNNIRVVDYDGTEHYHNTNYLAHEITEICAPGDSCYTAACVAFALQLAE